MRDCVIEDVWPAAQVVEEKIVKPMVNVSYPRVEGLTDEDVQWDINHSIQDRVYEMIENPQPGFVPGETEVTGEYRVTVNENGVLSLRFEVDSYTEGAAHGFTLVDSMTIDLVSGEVYRLGELFKPGSDYIDRINTIIKQELTDKNVPLTKDFETIGDDQGYYLTRRAVVVYFQLCEYTPYSFGIPEFEISCSNLFPAIDPKGPLARLVDPSKPVFIIRPRRKLKLNLRYR